VSTDVVCTARILTTIRWNPSTNESPSFQALSTPIP
jgi:hypothetical protein